jgi:hypothetical protein
MSEKKSLIDQLLEKAEDVLEAARRPYVRKRIKRAIESAQDSANDKADQAEIKITKLRKELVEDETRTANILKEIVELRNEIEAARRTADLFGAEQKELFN